MCWMWRSSIRSRIPGEEVVRGEDAVEGEKEAGVGVVAKAEASSEVEAVDVERGSVEGVKVGVIVVVEVVGGAVVEVAAAAVGKSTPMTKTPFHPLVVAVAVAVPVREKLSKLLLLLPLEAITPPTAQHRTTNGDEQYPPNKQNGSIREKPTDQQKPLFFAKMESYGTGVILYLQV